MNPRRWKKIPDEELRRLLVEGDVVVRDLQEKVVSKHGKTIGGAEYDVDPLVQEYNLAADHLDLLKLERHRRELKSTGPEPFRKRY